jgi:thrombospondin type 3 repeat protein
VRRVLAVLLTILAARAAADPFADGVVRYTIGTGGGAREADLPGVVLGPPRGGGAFTGSTDTFSLGLGGSIVLAFTDNVIVDGPGPDLTVFENAFLVRGTTTQPPYAEPGTVSVSADGVHWATFPCAASTGPYYPGCAGVYPVFANVDDPGAPSPLVPSTTPIADLVGVPVDSFTPPPGSGGDSFDLAAVGLHAARFVRIDASEIEARLGGLSGFDLDAIAAVHSVETAGLHDTDGDGIPDEADDCPTVPDPEQRDSDRDGVGDACQAGPLPDTDGDGVPDGSDNCPFVPNADQSDLDGDGVGDACDDCPTVPDPAQLDTNGDGIGDACQPRTVRDTDGDGVPDAIDDCPDTANPDQADADGDGAGDACDPCPHDPTCLPLAAPRFGGGGNGGPADRLLGCIVPETATTALPAGARTATVVLAIAPDVLPGSVRLRVGGRDVTRGAGDLVPGSTRTLTIPLASRRTVVRLTAKGPRAGGRRLVDRDRLIFLVTERRTR